MKLTIYAQHRDTEHRHQNDFPRKQDRVEKQNQREANREIRLARLGEKESQ